MRPSSSALRASIQSDAESVDAEPSHPMPTGHPGGAELVHRRQPTAADHHVRARAVGDAGAPLAEPLDLVLVRVDAVRDPRPVAPPPDVLEVLDGATAVDLFGVGVLVGVLGEVGVQAHVESLGELGGRRASARASPRTASTAPSATRTMAPHDGSWCSADEPLAVGEDLVVVLHDRVGRAGRRPSATGSSIRGWGGSGCRAPARRGSRRVMRSPPPRGCT